MVIRFIVFFLLIISQSTFAYTWQNVDEGIFYICDDAMSKLQMEDHSDVKSVEFQQNGNKLPSSSYSISAIYAGMTIDAIITLKDGSVVTESIQIKDEPKWTLRVDEGKSQLCNGNDATLKAVVRQGTRKIPADFSWVKDGEVVSTDENFSTQVSGLYTLNATAFGCTKSVNASVIPSPTPSISGNDGLCLGESLTLIASDMDSYEWQGGETSNSATFIASGNYYVVGTKMIGKTVCRDTLHFTIHPKMSANIKFGGVTAFCPGATETEISADHYLTESQIESYEWSRGGVTLSKEKRLTVTEEGRYRALVKTIDGCKSFSEVVITTVDTVADVVIPNLVNEICSGHQTAFSAEGQDLTRFEWFGSGLSFGSGDSQYSLAKAGNYSVVGYTTNGCKSKELKFHIDEIQSPSIFLESVVPCEGSVETISCTVTSGSEFFWISPDSINGITSKSISISHSGQYRAQVKDPVTGCISEAYTDVEFLPYPEISLSGDLAFCKNDGGVIQVDVDNRSNTKYNYSWIDANGNVLDSDSLVVLKKSGDYQVVVSNSHNCETRKDFSVQVNPAPKLKGDTLKHLCENSLVTLTMEGADHYQWSKQGKKLGSDSNKYKASSSGTFVVIGTNSNGCSDTARVKVELAVKPVITDVIKPACGSETEGMISLLTDKKCFFKWPDGSADSTFSFSTAEAFTVVVTDSVSGCRANHKVESVVREIPVGTINADKFEACVGDSLTLEASFSAQDGNVIYSWNCSDDTLSMISVGHDVSHPTEIIQVTATDSFGCVGYASAEVKFLELPHFEIQSADVVCKDSTATLTAQSEIALSYEWNNGNVGKSIVVDMEGEYTCTVTDDHGCVASKSKHIVLNSPKIQISGNPEVCVDSLSYLSVNGDCQQFYWDNNAVDTPFFYAPAGLAKVVGIDSFGCKAYAEMLITERKRPTLIAPDSVSFCERESVDVDFYSGDAVRFEWDGVMLTENSVSTDIEGDHIVVGYDDAGCPTEAKKVNVEMIPLPELKIDGKSHLCGMEDSASLAVDVAFCTRLHWNTGDIAKQIEVYRPGKYTVVGYNGGCVSDTATFEVRRVSLPKLDFEGGKTLSFCKGDSVKLVVNHADDVMINWKNERLNNSLYVNAEGFYVVEATDTLGCTSVDSVFAKASPSPFLSISGDTVVCENREVELVANGVECRKIVWSDGSVGKTLSVKDSGEFWAVGYDEMGCQSDTSYHSVVRCPVTEEPEPEDPEEDEETKDDVVEPEDPKLEVEISVDGKFEFCEGDSTEIALLAPSSYNIVWSNGSEGKTSIYKESGMHFAVATSSNGASDTVWFKINVHSNPRVMIAGNTQMCEGDSVKLTAVYGMDDLLSVGAGFKPARYIQWNNGKSGENITVYSGGEYSVVARSEFGCEGRDTIIVKETNLPKIVIDGADTLRRGESAILRASGGKTYWWGTGESTVPSIEITAGGRYKVTGTDSVGCKNVAYKDVVEMDVPVPFINGDMGGEIAICEGDSVLMIASGGDYYIWDDGRRNPQIYAKESRMYSVSVCFNNGACSKTFFNVRVLPKPLIDVVGNTRICDGEVAELMALQKSGSQLVDFDWSNGMKQPVVYTRDAETLSVVAKDVNGCVSNRVELSIDKYGAEEIFLDGDFDICDNSDDVARVVLHQTDVAKSVWIEESSGDTLSTLTECEFAKGGKYSVSVVNKNGCGGQKQFVIHQRSLPTVEIAGAENPVCGMQYAKLTAISDSKCTYEWNTAESGSEIKAMQSGEYTVVATNEYGCTAETSTQLIFNDIPDMMMTGNFKICPGESITIGVSGADVYEWSGVETHGRASVPDNGIHGDECTFSEPGNGYVIGKDGYGCQKRIDFTIEELPVPNVIVSATPAKIRRGDSDVSLALGSDDDLSECTYIWMTSDGETSSQQSFTHTFNADEAMVFSAIAVVETKDGCKLRLHATVETEFEIPNTFTPNGDMINDHFMKGYHVEIKDRHGIMLYQGNDGWNGVLPNGKITPDTYYYIVTDKIGQKHYGYVTVAG
ncbi:MAG: gliding motility-associated C-terminal domain-containing protein [Paludibacteraceae bacterium]|nr:gliding motility-associated C-terminal domain-containing protein [Paludibacteraceae bacterium]